MAKNEDHQITNFWSGFAFGITAASVAAFLLGTKKGREVLTNLMEASEGLDEKVSKLFEEQVLDKVPEEIQKIEEKVMKTVQTDEGGLVGIIKKIQSFSDTSKEPKKFFKKE